MTVAERRGLSNASALAAAAAVRGPHVVPEPTCRRSRRAVPADDFLDIEVGPIDALALP
jgi:hypothetical protein